MSSVHNDRITKEILLIAGVVVLGAVMSIIDTTVVNVALPTFQQVFHVEAYSSVAWTVTAYTLALAAVIPITGWAADRFGTKRLYLTAVILFTLGSTLCALAWGLGPLIAFRVAQGLGGGMLMPVGMTIMTRAAGPHRVGRLMAILGVPMLLGPILGPIIGGALIDSASWHWIFLINLPIGIFAFFYALRILPKDSPEPSETFDVLGMLMMSPGLALLLYGVSSIPGQGTVLAVRVLAPALVGIALIMTFVVYSFKPKHPLLDLRLFSNGRLALSTITIFLFASAFFGALLLVPTYFQQVRGESVLKAGLLVAPQGLGAMVTMPIAGALSDRLPIGRIVPFGLLGILIGLFGVSESTAPTVPYWHIMAFLFIMGLGMGSTMMPLFTSALRTLSPQQTARGSTLINVVQQIASSVGVSLMAVILTNEFSSHPLVKAAQDLHQAQLAKTTPSPEALNVAHGAGPAFVPTVLSQMADAFSTSYHVALVLIAVTLIPVSFLPRRREVSVDAPTVILH